MVIRRILAGSAALMLLSVGYTPPDAVTLPMPPCAETKLPFAC